MALKRRAFKVTRLKLDRLSADDKEKLEQLFAEYETQRMIAVEKHRLAVRAQSEAQIEMLRAQGLQTEFLREAAKSFSEVANEPMWFIFRRDGEIILESPFTERMQRNFLRAQISQMESTVRNTEEGQDDLNDHLYEEEGGTDEGEKPEENT